MHDKILIALTANGTLISAVPLLDEGYSIRRLRLYEKPGRRLARFEGTIASAVELGSGEAAPSGTGVRCAGRIFRTLEGTYGAPLRGQRLYLGRSDTRVEITSRVAWVGTMHRDRLPEVDALFEKGGIDIDRVATSGMPAVRLAEAA